jgi:hypothetical protein
MKEKVNATIDIQELKEKLCVNETPVWKQIPMVYAMVGWILTLGGGAFFAFGLWGIAIGGYFEYVEPIVVVVYSLLAILAGAVLTGLSHIYDW